MHLYVSCLFPASENIPEKTPFSGKKTTIKLDFLPVNLYSFPKVGADICHSLMRDH
jgi:hypothetical protein